MRGLDEGETAFWAAVAEAYPEIETGDLDPATVARLRAAMERAIELWVEANCERISR